MKLAAIFLCLFVATASAQLGELRDIAKEAMGHAVKCAMTVMPTKEDFDSLIAMENFARPKINCLLTCVMKGIGAMRKHTINVEKVAQMFTQFGPIKRSVDEITKVVSECKAEAEAGPQDCSMAATFAECCRSRLIA